MNKHLPAMVAIALSITTAAFAQVVLGTVFTYQGRLSDSGAAFTGNAEFQPTLWDAATNGSQVAANTPTQVLVSVTSGLFVLPLDFGASPFTRGQQLWLQLEVRTNGAPFTVLSPRQLLTASPYALYALSAGAAVTVADPPANIIPVLGMVWIRPGTFIMGTPTNDLEYLAFESPQTRVTLTKGFWMGAHEVTQAEYRSVMGSNPSWCTATNGFGDDLNRPVEQVSWFDATNYCGQLTQRERTAGRLSSTWRYRLPTEAEWEYCCRAGARTTRFCYGDDLSYAALGNYAWYGVTIRGTTHPVEQKLANPWGLMDMHGNVMEWCQDWYHDYPGGSVTDPQGPATGTYRIIRGGGWISEAPLCRSSARDYAYPEGYECYFGFRVVLAPDQP